MGTVTTLFVHKVLDAAGSAFDRAALLARVGLAPDDVPDPRRTVADRDYYALLETIARALPDATDLPLRVGASMRCDDYGAFGLAWKTAPTLADSFRRAARYARLLTSVARYELRPCPAGAFFLLHREGERRLGLRLSNEATLASVVAIAGQVSPGPFVPLEVHFGHGAGFPAGIHEARFGCPVIFGSDVDGVLVAQADLQRGNRLGDPALSRFLEPHLEEELEVRARDGSFGHRLLSRISERLAEGPPRAARIARDMGTSERTLHRRLSREGATFRSMLDTARRRLAEGLLMRSDHSIAEIAFLTGFSGQTPFTRACRRWFGRTPAALRGRSPARIRALRQDRSKE